MTDNTPQVAQNQQNMLAWMLEQGKRHGAVFILMGWMIFHFQGRTERLETKYDDCQKTKLDKVIEMLERTNTKNDELLDALKIHNDLEEENKFSRLKQRKSS